MVNVERRTPIKIKYGKYQLKNWEYFIELSCYSLEIIEEFIIDAAKDEIKNENSFRKHLGINFHHFKCAKSRPGLQDILSSLVQTQLKDYSPNTFDKILENLDSLLSDAKNRWAYEHTSSFDILSTKKENIYHMRHWEYFIDLYCINPDYIIESLLYATIEKSEEIQFKEMSEKFGEFYDIIKPGLGIIDCARTIEGLETMLLFLLRDNLKIEIYPSFFDKVLEKLDHDLDTRTGFSYVSFADEE